MTTTTFQKVVHLWKWWVPVLALAMALIGPTATFAQSCTYTVRAGDTLSQIATRQGTTVGAILQVNPTLTNPNRIRVGQQLQLPSCAGATSTPAPAAQGTQGNDRWVAPPLIPAPALPADLAPALWQRVHDATITIRHPIDAPAFSGSGVVIGQDGRTFLTAYHVIGNSMTGEEAREVLIGPFADWHYTAEVIATDPSLDLAVLRVREPDFPGFARVPLGSSMSMTYGTPIYTLSYPGIDAKLVSGKGGYLRSVMTFYNRAPLIVTNAYADFGSSGGVAVNARGEVIGIISAGLIGQQPMEMLGYAGLDRGTMLVPIEAATELLRQAGVR